MRRFSFFTGHESIPMNFSLWVLFSSYKKSKEPNKNHLLVIGIIVTVPHDHAANVKAELKLHEGKLRWYYAKLNCFYLQFV